MYLKDGENGTAPVRVCFVLPSAAGTQQLSWANGKEFANGIYYDEGAAVNIESEITYK